MTTKCRWLITNSMGKRRRRKKMKIYTVEFGQGMISRKIDGLENEHRRFFNGSTHSIRNWDCSLFCVRFHSFNKQIGRHKAKLWRWYTQKKRNEKWHCEPSNRYFDHVTRFLALSHSDWVMINFTIWWFCCFRCWALLLVNWWYLFVGIFIQILLFSLCLFFCSCCWLLQF